MTITNLERENMIFEKKNTTDIFLSAILVALVFLCVDQRLGIKNTQEGQEKLYELMKNYVGHVQAVNLTAEGRRQAFAQHFVQQVFKGDDVGRNEKLLEHGPAGIDAYLSLNGQDVVSGAKRFALSNSVYAYQVQISKFLSNENKE